MESKLQQLRKVTTVVADTGDIKAIKLYQPQDATTNPSLILKASKISAYAPLIDNAINDAKKQSDDPAQQVIDSCDMLAVNIGLEILNIIPGRVSTEVDARLSYDTQATVAKAQKLIALYEQASISKDRILIKIASTWQGIRAAEILEKQGINCNLTLLFSFAQAQASAEANVYLISPFVGRILDWHKKNEGRDFTAQEDPGVLSVTSIYNYYKQHDYATIIMGASFRSSAEILQLAGCDRLTISPELLQELSDATGDIVTYLTPAEKTTAKPKPLTEAQFLWAHNQDAMAVEKLAAGINQFAIDQNSLEEMIKDRLSH